MHGQRKEAVEIYSNAVENSQLYMMFAVASITGYQYKQVKQ